MEDRPDWDPEFYDLLSCLSELYCDVSEFRNAEDLQILKSSKTCAPLCMAYCFDKKKQENVSTVFRHNFHGYDLKDLMSEIKYVSKLEHSNILKFYENTVSMYDQKIGFIYEAHACLLSEVLDAGVDIVYRPEITKYIMKELFTALDYLHKNHIVHRDIQPENIALTYSGSVKVWNFQHAQTVGEPLVYMKASNFRYQPVESILQEGTAHPSLDIWSANVIFGELLLETFIFPTAGREFMLANIFAMLGFPTTRTWRSFFLFREAEGLMVYSSYMLNLLEVKYLPKIDHAILSIQARRLLLKNFRYFPKKRLSAEKCLAHNYFSEEPMAWGPDILETIARLTDVHRTKNLVEQEIARLKKIASV